MARYLLTGATGFVGSRLALHLQEAGHAIRIYRRPGSAMTALAGLCSFEDAQGTLHDTDAVTRAADGCDGVFHVAGMISYFEKDRAALHRANVDGTRSVCEGARRAGTPRVVVTSSVAAVGYLPGGGVADEDTPFNWPPGLPYMETKRGAETVALGRSGDDLEVVVVNPSSVMGPGDIRGSMRPLFAALATGMIPFYLPGGANIVDVDDLASGHLLAMQRGRSGRRYILGGHNLTHGETMQATARALGARAPLLPVPSAGVRLAAAVMGLAERAGLRLAVASQLLRLAGATTYVSSARAEQELGYVRRPAEETIRRSVSWYRKVGML